LAHRSGVIDDAYDAYLNVVTSPDPKSNPFLAFPSEGFPMRPTTLLALMLFAIPTAKTRPSGDLNSAIRNGDLVNVQYLMGIGIDPNTTTDEHGTPALITAAIYGNAAMLRALIEKGANPNVRDAGGATALILSAGDPEKARILVRAGADVNAQSASGRTALHVAAATAGGSEVVKMLLDKGARVDVRDNIEPVPVLFTGGGKSTPLAEAGRTGDLASIRMLVAAGADINACSAQKVSALTEAALYGRRDVVKWLLDHGAAVNEPVTVLQVPVLSLAAIRGDATIVRMLLAKGADANAKDAAGSTPLFWAVRSDYDSHDVVDVLLKAGADPNAKDLAGENALDLARRRGMIRSERLLRAAGAKSGRAAASFSTSGDRAGDGGAAQGNVQAALEQLGRAGEMSMKKSGCASCHHNTLPLVAFSFATERGLMAGADIQKAVNLTVSTIKPFTQILLEGSDVPPDMAVSGSYFLEGLNAQKYPAGRLTASIVHNIAMKQSADGRWVGWSPRAPLEGGDIQATAMAIRAIQLYPLPGRKAEMELRIQRAGMWLRSAVPVTTEDVVMRTLGLKWAGKDRSLIGESARQLAALQRSDGGWGQLPSLPADAYSTGKALYALRLIHGSTDYTETFRRGVRYLQRTQQPDGTWRVATRAFPFQPLIHTGFPNGRDQWISAAATSWATIALLMNPEAARESVTRPRRTAGTRMALR
jgi:ankyrin repeat protein